MITKYGDIFTSDAKAIGHGVNCKGKMGAGIAKQFRSKFPKEYFEEYERVCLSGDLTPGKIHMWDSGTQMIYNIASQNELGRDAREAWLTSGLMEVAMETDSVGNNRVAIPAIGCGIGGLHLDALYRAINMAEQFVFGRVQFELWLYE